MAEENKPAVKELYINGFYIGLRAADAQLYVSINAQPLATLNMSLITLKNLSTTLASEIEHYETSLGIKIPALTDVQSRIDAFNLKLKESEESDKK